MLSDSKTAKSDRIVKICRVVGVNKVITETQVLSLDLIQLVVVVRVLNEAGFVHAPRTNRHIIGVGLLVQVTWLAGGVTGDNQSFTAVLKGILVRPDRVVAIGSVHHKSQLFGTHLHKEAIYTIIMHV